VSRLKDDKLIKKQTYTKTEVYRLYSRVFWIFLQNVIKIHPYNFEVYHFKVCAFFSETQCILLLLLICNGVLVTHLFSKWFPGCIRYF